MESKYVSGNGKDSVVPEEIKGWNWGAFFLNWIWGIGNSTYIALLMFIPILNIVMMFVLGAKGSEWAWKNRTWRDVEHFKSTQKKWRNAAFVFVLLFVPLIVIPVMTMMKGEAFDLSVAMIKQDPQVIELVGDDLKPGFFVLGEVSLNGSGGEANLNYSIEGYRGSAEVYVYAIKQAGNWELKRLLVISDDTEKTLDIIKQID